MFKNAFGYNLRPIQKICLTGLLIALTTILQKVVAINYIPVIPFVRVSLGGPALIIFASVFLGPIYGLAVGLASDILGYFIFDPKTYSFFPQITAIYALMGLASYFVFVLVKLIKNEVAGFAIEMASLFSMAGGLSLYFITIDEITLYSTTYQITTASKIVIPIVLFGLFAGLAVVLWNMRKIMKKNDMPLNIWQISFACFLIELVIMVLFGSLMKSIAFSFNYFIIAICQIVVLFINVPLNTFFIGTFLRLTNRFKDKRVESTDKEQ